jgi:hypothetical protein
MQIIVALLIFVALGTFIYTFYEFHFNLKPQKNSKKPLLITNLKIIKKYLRTSDGLKISSWYIPVKNPKAVIILVHGYKKMNEDKIRLLPHAEYLNSAGYSTILIDLRSFGKSEGDKTSLGIQEWKDVETAYDYAKSLPENKNKIIGFYGKSMGGVTAIITRALTDKGDFIIALTPYASFGGLFNFQLKQKGYYIPIFLPLLHLAGLFEFGFGFERYAPISLIKKIKVPIFIAGAKYDDAVPKKDAKRLFNKANSPKEFWDAPTDHDEIFRQNPEEFKKKILAFLSKYV